MSWHDEQLCVSSWYGRGTLNNRSPRTRRRGSWVGMAGIVVIGSRPARVSTVGDCAVAGEAALRQTSASRRQAILRPGTGAIATAGINAGAGWHGRDIVE